MLKLQKNVGTVRVGNESVKEILYKGIDSNNVPFLFYTYVEAGEIRFRYLDSSKITNVTPTVDATTKDATYVGVVLLNTGLTGDVVLFEQMEGTSKVSYSLAGHSTNPANANLPWNAGIMSSYFTNIPDNFIAGATTSLGSDLAIVGNASNTNSTTLPYFKPKPTDTTTTTTTGGGTNTTTTETEPEKPKAIFLDAPVEWIKENPLLAGGIGVGLVVLIFFVILPALKGEPILGGILDANSSKSKSLRRLRR